MSSIVPHKLHHGSGSAQLQIEDGLALSQIKFLAETFLYLAMPTATTFSPTTCQTKHAINSYPTKHAKINKKTINYVTSHLMSKYGTGAKTLQDILTSPSIVGFLIMIGNYCPLVVR